MPSIFCAIDTTDFNRAMTLAAAMQRVGCGIKLGLEFFNAHGPQGVCKIRESYPDLPLFLDLKYHDIPNTVAGAMRAIAPLGIHYVNLHASGGLAMMRAAKDALAEEIERLALVRKPKILGVTILTSLDDEALDQVGFKGKTAARVVGLAKLTEEAGLDGVVCSANEIEIVRAACGSAFVLMVPGIRPAASAKEDQKRVMTPGCAVKKGATHLVIGRPITQEKDPSIAAKNIIISLNQIAA